MTTLIANDFVKEKLLQHYESVVTKYNQKLWKICLCFFKVSKHPSLILFAPTKVIFHATKASIIVYCKPQWYWH